MTEDKVLEVLAALFAGGEPKPHELKQTRRSYSVH
jgi:hypothetical protein